MSQHGNNGGLAAMRAAHSEGADAGTDAGDERDVGGESTCKQCGGRFDPRGLHAHERACDGESPDGGGNSGSRAPPNTVERRLGLEGAAVRELSAARVAEAIEEWQKSHDGGLFEGVRYTPHESDAQATAAAKAMAREKTGEPYPDSLVHAFGECADPSCTRWANGYERGTCARSSCEPQDGVGSDATTSEPAYSTRDPIEENATHPNDALESQDGPVVETTVPVGGAVVSVRGTPEHVADAVAQLTE